MKVLELIPNLQRGGAERFFVDLCNELSNRNVELKVIVLYAEDNLHQELLHELNTDIEILFLDKKDGFDFSMYQKLKAIIKQEKPDIVHTHLRTFLYAQFLIRKFPNVFFTHTIHTDPKLEFKGALRYIALHHLSYNNAAAVTISDESLKAFQSITRTLKGTLIQNGRSFPKKSKSFDKAKEEIDRIRQNFQEHKVIINIANIVPIKNHKLLLHAFSKILAEKVILLIIGSHIVYKDLYKELKGIQPDNVFFLGEKQNATDYLYMSDSFCLTSFNEGAPISLLEAMAIGVIPICSPVGSMNTLITNEENGFLLESIDVKSFLGALDKRLKLDQNQVDVMSARLKKQFIDHYSIKTCAQSYLNMWTSKIINH